MWIGNVDIPEELVQAARAGRLVIFVGAGASRDAPASLPDFARLTSDIAAEAAIQPGDNEAADRFLGRLRDAGVDVHRRVRAHIDLPGSDPNALHAAIVDLASATRAPRIVTTNYDLHVSRVAEGRALNWDEYAAPALPMGDDFEGIVYLHGSLRQDPRNLIVTDADFGRAYLRDAWAARFLERMFPSFTVLFVGYSHGDVVMRYLARSLGSESSRYVLTPDPDARDWRELNLRPVAYELRGASHIALSEAITRWARLLSMGLLEHRQQLAQLVAAPPSSVPEEKSYLASVIGDEHLVTLFTDLATGELWIRWAAQQPEGRRMFDPNAEWTGSSPLLAFWFAQQCLADEALCSVGLSIMSEAGGGMSASLWNAIGQQLHGKGSPRPGWLQPWLVLLVENAPRETREWLEYALAASVLPGDREVALLLFDQLTEPHIVLKPPFLGAAPRFDVEIRGDEYWLREAWTKVLHPNLRTIVGDVLAIADRHLRRAHQLLVAAGAAKPGWDPVSFGRSSIAAHPQDRHGDRIGIVIDAARDCLEFVVADASPSAAALIAAWSASDAPILRRLAIHGVALDKGTSGTDKLAWLLAHGWLFGHQLKHEVFELLAAALPSASEAIVDRVVADAELGPGDVGDDDVRAYEAFNALVWIDRHSNAPSARAALDRAQAEHPTFGIRDHPDFDKWMESGFRGPNPPMTVEEFVSLLRQDRAAALGKLGEFRQSAFSMDKPTWDDALSLVTLAVEESPEDGFVLLSRPADLDNDLIGAVLRGWGARELGDETAYGVIDQLSTLDLDQWSDELAQLIGGSGGGKRRTEWYRFGAARGLARAIARRLPDEPVPSDVSNWLEKAVNAPAGLLAEFWLNATSHDWTNDRDSWTGLSAETRGAIDELLDAGSLHRAIAETVLASQVHFFFAADREWCQTNVLPLLSWDNAERARRTWDGFLFWGRWSDQLLEAGLLRDYLDTARHIEGFEDEMRRQFAEHVAAIALYSEIDPSTWTPELTRSMPPRERVEWLNQIAWAVDRLDADVRQRQWNRWMRAYWAQRLATIPLALSVDEASSLAGWSVKLDGAAIDEAVDLAVKAPAAIQQHGYVLHDLTDHVERAPAAYARLLGHLLAGTNPPFWDCHYLARIMEKLRGRAAEEDLRRIREQALRLGCNAAPSW